MVVGGDTGSQSFWTGARTVRVWSIQGEWKQSLETHGAGRVTSMIVEAGNVWISHDSGKILVFDSRTAACKVRRASACSLSIFPCDAPSTAAM